MTDKKLSPKTKERTCLRCHKPFPSRGPGNRICLKCTGVNAKVGTHGRLHSRGVRRGSDGQHSVSD